MRTQTHRRPDRLLGTMALIGAGLLAAFWGLYGTGVIPLGRGDSVVTAFEAAFPAADLFLCVLLTVAGVGLLRASSYGHFAMIAAGATTVYLGLLDFTFYTRQGFYSALNVEAVVELTINLVCLAAGGFALIRSWRSGRMS